MGKNAGHVLYREEDLGFETPCHIWQGGRSGDYGWYKGTFAHRHFWAVARGPIPPGGMIHHRCRQKRCVRVSHLRLVSGSEHRLLHPESARRNRLDKNAVRDIRTSPLSLKDIAQKYQISKSYASKVRAGLCPLQFAVPPEELPHRPLTPQKSWNKGTTRLTLDAVADIRSSELSLRAVAMKYGISATYAMKIRRGQVLRD